MICPKVTPELLTSPQLAHIEKMMVLDALISADFKT